MPDPESGIGIIYINKIACTPRQLNLEEKRGMGQDCGIPGDELEPSLQKSGGLEKGVTNFFHLGGGQVEKALQEEKLKMAFD